MGGPLSRCLADLIIENKIEKQISEHTIWGPKWDWVRLIDDTLSVWESKDTFLDFFDFLNTLHPGIQWTNEMEEGGKNAIFDVLITRTEAGYSTTVHRKKSASDRYIHYTSAQPWKEKASAIRTLKNRAIKYCSNEQLLAEELTYLLEVFIQNGYPEKTVWNILYQESRSETPKENVDYANALHIPFHPRAQKLYKILQEEFGLTVVYKKTQTLGDILLRKGRSIEKNMRKNVIYSIPCKDCPKKYIGQTSVTIKKRCNEHANWCKKKHKRKILKSTKKNDGIAFHHHQTGHNIDFEGTTILAEEKSYWRRLIIEGIEIKKLDPAHRANMQLGYEIDARWDPVLYPKKPGTPG